LLVEENNMTKSTYLYNKAVSNTTPIFIRSKSYFPRLFHYFSPTFNRKDTLLLPFLSIHSSYSTKSNSKPDLPSLTHVDPDSGRASMVNVSTKNSTYRTAIANGKIHIGKQAFELVRTNTMKKGDVLTTAQIAGIMAAKQTGNIIPLCHPLLLSHINVNLEMDEKDNYAIKITSKVECEGKTGVEMEALTAVSITALTIFDMCKSVGKGMIIGDLKVVEKTGGKSGTWKFSDS
jgi:molybdenum cofactor biosynthesis protein MoaC